MAEARHFRRPRRGGEPNPLLEMPKLLDAALDEFSRRSFDEASLNGILKAAGLNKGSFYYRFADKLDLYLCMSDTIFRAKMASFARAHAATDFPEDFFDQVRTIAGAGLAFARDEPRYQALTRRYLAERPAIRQAVKDAFPGAAADALQPLIGAARAKGQFRSSFPDAFVKGIVELLFNHIDALMGADASDEDIEQLLDNLIEMLQRGLAADPVGDG